MISVAIAKIACLQPHHLGSPALTPTAKLKEVWSRSTGIIPTCNDHNPLAHLRCPMVIMRQG